MFDLHAAFVWRVLERHGVARRELEDGCQEVFLVLYRRASELDRRASVRTWLYGVAVRIALGMRRRAYRRREQLTDPSVERGAEREPFEALHSRELYQQLMAALTNMTRARREVFVLYELEEMTIGQVAEALGIPANTALYRLQAARQAIAVFVHKNEIACELTRVRRRRGWEIAR